MGIASSKATIKAALVGIDVIDIDQAELCESGTFILYDGGERTSVGIVERVFCILCAGFSLGGSSDLLSAVESIEHKLYQASLEDIYISHTRTHPVVIAENGLCIYRIDVKIIDMES